MVLVLHPIGLGMGVRDTDVGSFTPSTHESGLSPHIYSHPARFVELPSAVSGLEGLGAYFEAVPGGASSVEAIATPSPYYMRFRRGDGWQLGRVRNLTTTSIGVACGCPPGKDDEIEIELRAGDVEVLVDAVVLAVTPAETAEVIGAYGFGARFFDVDAFARNRLRKLVALVDAEEEPLAQPPRRRHPRFPVYWPVDIASARTVIRGFAVDVSARGLFVASDDPPAVGSAVSVSLPEELGECRLHLRARVTRTLTREEALVHRATAGFGLEIVSMNRRTAARYAGMVGRVAQRARYPVLVVAGPERLERMTSALRAVGYPVSSMMDLASLVRNRGLRSTRAALVILDASAAGRDGGWIDPARYELRGCGIPCVVLRDGPARRAWRLADSALLR